MLLGTHLELCENTFENNKNPKNSFHFGCH
jgi:hypothetical protein